MKLPRTMEINGEVWRVVKRVPPDPHTDGMCGYSKRTIYIHPDLPKAEIAETFLHEVLHACLPETTWGARVEEKMVRRLAPRLLTALRGIGWVK